MQNSLSNLRFADDIVLFSKSTTEAEAMIKELNESGKKIELRTNRMKTYSMKNQWCYNEHIKLDGYLITETSSRIHIDSEALMGPSSSKEIRRHMDEMNCAEDATRLQPSPRTTTYTLSGCVREKNQSAVFISVFVSAHTLQITV
ncbi:hypothetical protein KIN20_003213 [Parelaphostrongylus tenuis]|uniref:Reverse transcriptase domain-containing protein n=1 Tax=Parelaphostrongylus tenuis TaxID=148309 RepID=A0AAD5LYT7_PARTN|nr:hypothetical protein KIN20_003213 [Parelaphostrongylus tenuis]